MKGKGTIIIVAVLIGLVIGFVVGAMFPLKARAASIVTLPPWTVSVGTGAVSPASFGNIGALKIGNVQPYAWGQIAVPAYNKKAAAMLRLEQDVRKNQITNKYPPLRARIELGYTF